MKKENYPVSSLLSSAILSVFVLGFAHLESAKVTLSMSLKKVFFKSLKHGDKEGSYIKSAYLLQKCQA